MTGRWNITPCSQPEALVLAERLGISETTARVLLRRGYADADAAERFIAGGDPGYASDGGGGDWAGGGGDWGGGGDFGGGDFGGGDFGGF